MMSQFVNKRHDRLALPLVKALGGKPDLQGTVN
jgi:hypothetical protein